MPPLKTEPLCGGSLHTKISGFIADRIPVQEKMGSRQYRDSTVIIWGVPTEKQSKG
jgi:hypothetical protein